MAKKSNIDNIKNLSLDQLKQTVRELKAGRQREKFDSLVSGNLDAIALNVQKKDIARLLTEITAREKA
ncbi:MAG: 50S ribosomal protein L29 [Saprospiraceae bacterium]|jgi:ribosomal protein L29|nr:50S ribosomal protein L29 [Saprospiraceae bacterium]MBL0295490.1 50S ribosomal protein L29 [Saprospiraceae bacterium]